MMAQPSDHDKLVDALAAAQREIDRLKAETEQAKSSYANLFESAGDSIFIIDVNTYTIIAANAHAARRFGYAPDELIGLSMEALEVIDPIDDTQPFAWESTVSQTTIYECFYRHKNGDRIAVEVSSRVVKVGQQQTIQNFVRNISLRKQLEAEREQLIADLDSFAHTVAHDLKDPMSTVFSYTEFLKEICVETPGDELLPHLQHISAVAWRAINIVDALLLFASVRKQEQIEREPLKTAEIVMQVQERLANMAKQYDAEIIVPTQWPTAIGFAPWVAEIWTNYISNAIKYGGTPPRIELGAAPADNQMVRFWVRDNGAGIPDDKLHLLFDKFNRLGDFRVEGHGLGLSIAKRIAEKLGGSVDVTSVVGEGSIFSFFLPAL
jgi:PAS domain S-box-containing protein